MRRTTPGRSTSFCRWKSGHSTNASVRFRSLRQPKRGQNLNPPPPTPRRQAMKGKSTLYFTASPKSS